MGWTIGEKVSKSVASSAHAVGLLDPLDQVKKKIMRATTIRTSGGFRRSEAGRAELINIGRRFGWTQRRRKRVQRACAWRPEEESGGHRCGEDRAIQSATGRSWPSRGTSRACCAGSGTCFRPSQCNRRSGEATHGAVHRELTWKHGRRLDGVLPLLRTTATPAAVVPQIVSEIGTGFMLSHIQPLFEYTGADARRAGVRDASAAAVLHRSGGRSDHDRISRRRS